jgi:hypothetical protein
MDRYHSHTANCASCRGALAKLKRVRVGVAGVGAIAWVTTPILMGLGQTLPLWLTAVSGLLAIGCLAGWGLLGQLERRFYEGREIPPRNLPEKRKK